MGKTYTLTVELDIDDINDLICLMELDQYSQLSQKLKPLLDTLLDEIKRYNKRTQLEQRKAKLEAELEDLHEKLNPIETRTFWISRNYGDVDDHLDRIDVWEDEPSFINGLYYSKKVVPRIPCILDIKKYLHSSKVYLMQGERRTIEIPINILSKRIKDEQ